MKNSEGGGTVEIRKGALDFPAKARGDECFALSAANRYIVDPAEPHKSASSFSVCVVHGSARSL